MNISKGVLKQIQESQKPTYYNPSILTYDLLKKVLEDIFKSDKKETLNIKDFKQYLDKTSEELRKELPEGGYYIGNTMIIGKEGFIQFIEKLRNKATEKKRNGK